MNRMNAAVRFAMVAGLTFIILFAYQNCTPQMQADSGVGSDTANSASLTAINVTLQPAGMTITTSGEGLLTVAGTSTLNKPLYYQWYLNGTPVSNSSTPTLTITAATSANQGYYYASITDGTNTVYSSSAWVQIGNGTTSCTLGTYNNGSCYLFVASAMTFENAAAYCTTQGGTLAKVGSAADNAFILSSIGSTAAWVGGTNSSTGYYEWQDGSLLSYTNWAPGEPNDAGGNEHCLEIYASSGLWNDSNCAGTNSFVCQL